MSRLNACERTQRRLLIIAACISITAKGVPDAEAQRRRVYAEKSLCVNEKLLNSLLQFYFKNFRPEFAADEYAFLRRVVGDAV